MKEYYPETDDEKNVIRTDSLRRTVRYVCGAVAEIDQAGPRSWSIKFKNHKPKSRIITGTFLTMDQAEEALHRYEREAGLEVKEYSRRHLSHEEYSVHNLEEYVSYKEKIQPYIINAKAKALG
ncbi:hypothetical protein G6M85_03040 [Agrobacterium tumefaciens]|jgi:hypothetical protein|uniref:hypothetical protein n=1 Tax=Agrobacterium tumefaciens TaxID=358 RepID=UPI000DD06084|nr:hypothetical protein [Agrobacterium tumefaciens]NTE64585.1 hypothetical protein [Agrobacterium tumefaciens]